MAIDVNWYNDEQTIILHRFEGAWSWSEFRTAVHTAWEMMGSVSHPERIHSILDLRGGNTLPSNDALQYSRYLAVNRPLNGGLIVIIAANTFLKTVIQIGLTIYRHVNNGLRVEYADSIPDACAIIEQASRTPSSS